ncbi:MAG: hypothetical protein ACOYKZ_04005 [Chlamydiia bacterium]
MTVVHSRNVSPTSSVGTSVPAVDALTQAGDLTRVVAFSGVSKAGEPSGFWSKVSALATKSVAGVSKGLTAVVERVGLKKSRSVTTASPASSHQESARLTAALTSISEKIANTPQGQPVDLLGVAFLQLMDDAGLDNHDGEKEGPLLGGPFSLENLFNELSNEPILVEACGLVTRDLECPWRQVEQDFVRCALTIQIDGQTTDGADLDKPAQLAQLRQAAETLASGLQRLHALPDAQGEEESSSLSIAKSLIALTQHGSWSHGFAIGRALLNGATDRDDWRLENGTVLKRRGGELSPDQLPGDQRPLSQAYLVHANGHTHLQIQHSVAFLREGSTEAVLLDARHKVPLPDTTQVINEPKRLGGTFSLHCRRITLPEPPAPID